MKKIEDLTPGDSVLILQRDEDGRGWHPYRVTTVLPTKTKKLFVQTYGSHSSEFDTYGLLNERYNPELRVVPATAQDVRAVAHCNARQAMQEAAALLNDDASSSFMLYEALEAMETACDEFIETQGSLAAQREPEPQEPSEEDLPPGYSQW